MTNNNYLSKWMRNIFIVLLIAGTAQSYAQTTVTVTCTGSAGSFNSGSVNAAGTKNDGNMITINSSSNRGWAHFDLSVIPAGATVTAVTANFTTYSSTLSSAVNNLYGFTGNPSAIAGATLYANCLSGSSFNASSWSANALQTKVFNAAGIAFIQANINSNNANIGYVRGSTNTYNIGGYPGSPAAAPNLVITYTGGAPCSGTPAPGNTLSSNAAPCSGVNFTLSLQNSTSGSGVTYQWYANAGAGYSTIAGATSSTLLLSQTVATSYYCDVTCSGNTGSSTPLAVGLTTGVTCLNYCAAQATNTIDEEIFQITVNGATTPAPYANNCNAGPGPGSLPSQYSNFKTLGALTTVQQGQSVSFEIRENECDGATYYANGIAVYIDFNQNGDFTGVGEAVYLEGTTTAATGLSPAGDKVISFNYTIPVTATTGLTGMRIITSEGVASPLPCANPGYGEVEDWLINITAAVACSGTPAPGNTISSSASVCPSVNFTLSLQNSTLGSGVSYQWYSNSGAGYNPVSGATNSTLTTSQTVATSYYCDVTCSGNGTGSSNPVAVGMNGFFACYCTSGLGGSCAINSMSSVAIAGTTLNNVTGGCTGTYNAFPQSGSTTANLVPGTPYTMNVGVIVGSNTQVVCWIDYNHDGIFSAAEYSLINNNIPSGGSGSGSFTIPLTALSGATGMRVRSDWQGTTAWTASDACATRTWGETEDYIITIVPLPATPANPVESGLPDCILGNQIVATGSAPGGETWYWQTTASGTSTAQNASTPLTIYGNGTYYIRSQDNTYLTWSSGAGSITVTDYPFVASPPNPTAGQNPVCVPGSTTLTVAAAPSGTTYYWQGINPVGTSTADDAALPYTVTAAGTYYVMARDNSTSCWSSVPGSIVMTSAPGISMSSVTATPATICPGDNSILTAVASGGSVPTSADLYTFSTTTGVSLESLSSPTNIVGLGLDDAASASIPIGFSFNFSNTNYTTFSASSNGLMTLGGVVTTAYSNSTTAATMPGIMPMWDDLYTGSDLGVQYQVLGSAPNRKLVVEWNTNNCCSSAPAGQKFQVWLFETTGVIEFVYGPVPVTPPGSSSVGIISSPTQYQSINTSTQAASTTTITDINSVWPGNGRAYIFSSPVSYSWNPPTYLSSTSGASVTASGVAATTTYTCTASAGGCSAQGTATVTLLSVPAAPTVTGGATTCGAGTVSVSAVAGGAGTLRWWDAAVGGNSLGNGVSSINVSVINADVTVWVEEYNGTCSGPRSPVTAVYTAPPSIIVSSDVAFVCYGGTNTGPGGINNNTANLSTTDGGGQYSSFTWMPGNLTGQSVAVTPSATTTYTVTASGGGCTNVSTVTVNGGAVPVINSVTATPATVCQGNTSQLIAAVAGGSGGSTPPTGYCSPTMFVGVNSCDYIQSVATSGGVANFSNFTGSTWVTGDTYFPASVVSQTLGGSFTLSVQAGGTCSISYYDVWIDWNRDGAFNMTDEHMVTANSVNTQNILTNFTINIPVTASPGATRMRVTNHGNSANPVTACDNLTANYSENEDYVVEVLGGGTFTYAWTGAGLSATNIFNPVATLGAASTLYGVTVTDPYGCHSSGSVTLTEPSSNPGNTQSTVNPVCATTSFTLSVQNPGVGASYQWQSSPDGTTWTNISGATNATYTTTQSSSTYYQCSVGCPSGGSFSNPLQVVNNLPTACYCSPSFTNYDGTDYIANVTLNTLNNTTVGTPIPCYTNYSPMGTSLLLGQSYTISMTAGTFTGENYSAWIDFNQSGSFEEPERILPNSVNSTGGQTFTATFTVPAGAIPGVTRMRCVDQYAGLATPCPTSSYGEAEDYQITIIAPNASSNSPVCQGTDLNLFSPTTGTSYSWTTTASNGFTSSQQDPVIPNATAADAGVYTVHITFAGGSFLDASVTVVINPAPVVAPTASAAFCEGTAALDLHANAPTGVSYIWRKLPSLAVVFSSADPSILAAPASASGTYRAIVTDANGCKDSATVVATVWALPVADITPIGSTNICTGQTTTDLQATGGTDYLWANGETSDLITVSTGGTYTVTVTDANGCVNTDSQVITESSAPAAPIVTPAGPINLCSSDGGMTFSSATLTCSNYSSDLLWSTSETTASITIDYADIFNVTYTDANGCYSVSNSVTTNALLASADPVSVTTNAANNNICNGNSVMLTVNGGSLGDGAEWKWYTAGCGTGGGVSTMTTATYSVSPTSTTTYYVRAEGTCNSTACSQVTVTVSNAPPTNTIHAVAAPTVGCNGSVALMSVNAVANATFYSWNGTSGALYSNNIGGPFVAGPYQTTAPQVYIQFLNPAPAGNSGYSICAFAGNACGQSNTICKWVRSKVSQPGVISGSNIGCPNTNGTYSVAPVIGADTYTWTVSGNAGINGGGTTLTTASNSITVNFGAAYTSGTLSVIASLNCGFNSSPRTMSISNTPAQPGAMSGPTFVCPGNSASFSVPAVTGAASYNWSCSVAGAVITPSGNSCSILFPAVVPAGSTVCVSAVSSCGNASALRCKGIANGIPGTPGNISGPTAGQCGQSGVSYSVLPVSQATGYIWTVNNGATISGPNNLSSVSVNFPASFTTCTLTVAATNGCGTGLTRTLVVSGVSAQPGLFTAGNQNVCNGSIESYTTGGSAGATSYNWTSPAGSTILNTPPYGPTIAIQWGATGGNVTVAAVNDCGTSPSRSLAVAVTCRQSQLSETLNTTANLYPNPTSGKTTVKFESSVAAKYVISVVDVTGRIIISDEVAASEGINMHELDLTSVARGIYMVRLESHGEQSQLLKVTVE